MKILAKSSSTVINKSLFWFFVNVEVFSKLNGKD